MQTPGWMRRLTASPSSAAKDGAAGSAAAPDGDAQGAAAPGGAAPAGPGGSAEGGNAGSRRTRIILLSAAGVGVLVVAGVTIGTLGSSSTAGHATTVSDHGSSGAKAAAAPALQVESVTQGGAVTGTNGASPVRVTLSAPLASNSAMPVLHPSTPGTWAKTGSTLTFTPATPFWPGSRVRVTLPVAGPGSGPPQAGSWPRP